MNTKLNILIADDNNEICKSLETALVCDANNVYIVNDPKYIINHIVKYSIDVLILDWKFDNNQEIDGLGILKLIRESEDEVINKVDVVLLTGYAGEDLSVMDKAHKLNAFVLSKPADTYLIKTILKRRKELFAINEEKIRFKEITKIQCGTTFSNFSGFIGVSKQVEQIKEEVKTFADSNLSVLITGETGTGKEVIAKLIYLNSQRKGNIYITVNCAAIPEAMAESEFFGYYKGAFTGAEKDTIGYFEAADKGTLFLDEIGDLPILIQPKLFRAIREKAIYRLGAEGKNKSSIPIDVRIISATNQDICDSNRFRKELLSRIKEAIICIPPLRERKEDIEPLLLHFIKKHTLDKGLEQPTLDNNVLAKLIKYDFPLNVAELESMVKVAIVRAKFDGVLKARHFQIEIENQNTINNNLFEPYIANLDENFKTIIKFLVEENRKKWENIPPEKIPNIISLDNLPKIVAETVHEATGQNKKRTAKLLGTTVDKQIIRDLK